MHYLAHQSVDAINGIIVDAFATPGNVTDATPYIERIHCIQTENIAKIERDLKKC
ncbi:hypothetical protein BN3590_02309 [Clostridium sp. C105KSO15]|nr:hypothetical protein BN3590_02309 [Clostridium sp. C105KSO15]